MSAGDVGSEIAYLLDEFPNLRGVSGVFGKSGVFRNSRRGRNTQGDKM